MHSLIGGKNYQAPPVIGRNYQKINVKFLDLTKIVLFEFF